jgi:hypothetical protein
VRVGRQASALPRERSARDEGTSLAALAEAVVLELEQHAAGEVVVDLGDVYVLRAEPRLAVEALRQLLGAARRVELVRDVGVREVAEGHAPRRALLAREDLDRAPREVTGAIRGRDDHRARTVALETAIEEPVRAGDHRRRLVVGEGHRLAAHHRPRIPARVLAEGHRDVASCSLVVP